MAVKGLDNLLDVIDLVKNSDKYDAKIAELKEQTAKYQEVIEAVVKLSAVNEYTQNISKREAESKALLEAAKAEAGSITSEAKANAAVLKAKNKELVSKAEAVVAAAVERELAVAEKQAAVEEAAKAVAADKEKLAKEREALAQEWQEFKDKRAKLLAAIN